jgi:mevalonate kinase
MTTSDNMRPKSTKGARSPGKIILSGEHSVVYGAPALVAAVDQYTDVWFTPLTESRVLQTAFGNISKGEIYGMEAIGQLRQKLDDRFELFEKGKLPIQQILQRPDDLAIYTIARLLVTFPVPGVKSGGSFPVPGRLSSRSDLPLGAGMGSSAAIIAATLVLYEHFLGKRLADQTRFEWVRFCERLQHGKGSAVDAAAVILGGLNRVERDKVTGIQNDDAPIELGDNWYWVLTGIPAVSTGECVATVRKKHGKDSQLWDAFAAITNALETELKTSGDCIATLRENHKLLNQIGVVTPAAQQFIADVEAAGGAAKISGAGATKGENSGIVLVRMPDHDRMTNLMRNYANWSWRALNVSQTGAHLYDHQTAEIEARTAISAQVALDVPSTAQ